MSVEQHAGITVPVPIVAALVSAGIAAVVAWLISRKTRRDQERSELNALVAQLNAITIQYPILEDDDFCAKWPPKAPPAETDMRYDNYCCLVFNLVERLWRHFKGNAQKINDFFGATEMICRHRKWWLDSKNRTPNYGGYPLEFVQYVDAVLKEIK